MGLINNSKRVQIGISKSSTIFRNQGNGCECKQSGYPKFRNRKFATKSSNRTCTFCSTTPRFLQYLFPGSEKVGRPAGCDKFETPQSVSQNSTFQDGYSEDCSKSSQERRLGNINRLERRIFPRVNSPEAQEISSFLHSGQSISVPSTSFRSQNLAESFYKDSGSGCSSSKNAKHQIGCIPGRLVSSECKEKISPGEQGSYSQSFFSTRLLDKQRKIKPGPYPRYNIHRREVLLRQGYCHAYSREIVKLRRAVIALLGEKVSARQYLQTLGLMASCIEIIPNARLQMRPIQLHLLYWWKPVSRDLEMIIPKSRHLREHLSWWLQEANIVKGRSLSQIQASKIIATDASTQMWGGNLDHQIIQGFWSEEQKELHINCLELEAVILTIKNFLPQLRNQCVLVRSDNTTVIQYICRQGGTRSPQLCYKTWDLWQLAIKNNIILKAAHIAGKLNILPDQLSRIVIRPTEWTLNDTVLRKIFQIWGVPIIDLFASYLNKKMAIFCTWDHHPLAYAVDAFSVTWNQMFAYAFPPICLIPKVLEHMKQGHCQVILIAPQWPRRHWYPDLLQLCIANPIKLPVTHNLLSQPNTIIYHPDPKVFNLNAWLLSTDNSLQTAFHRKLETYCPHLGEQALKKTILVNSNSSVVGVVGNKLIHIQHL